MVRIRYEKTDTVLYESNETFVINKQLCRVYLDLSNNDFTITNVLSKIDVHAEHVEAKGRAALLRRVRKCLQEFGVPFQDECRNHLPKGEKTNE